MSQINFLPESFQRIRRRQQRRPIEFAIIGGTALILTALWLHLSGPDAALARQSEQLDEEIRRVDQVETEQARLEQERGRLTGKLLIARETYQPILASQVLSRLSELTPEPIRLVSFELDAERPKPEAVASPGDAKKKKVVGDAVNKPDEPREPNLMKISMVGLSPSDEEVVVLIRRIEQDPVFSSVSLRKSRMTKTKTHHAREFELELEIDLDRRFVPLAGPGGERDAD